MKQSLVETLKVIKDIKSALYFTTPNYSTRQSWESQTTTLFIKAKFSMHYCMINTPEMWHIRTEVKNMSTCVPKVYSIY